VSLWVQKKTNAHAVMIFASSQNPQTSWLCCFVHDKFTNRAVNVGVVLENLIA
jgi:hypothetical protein